MSSLSSSVQRFASRKAQFDSRRATLSACAHAAPAPTEATRAWARAMFARFRATSAALSAAPSLLRMPLQRAALVAVLVHPDFRVQGARTGVGRQPHGGPCTRAASRSSDARMATEMATGRRAGGSSQGNEEGQTLAGLAFRRHGRYRT